jgi:hypothetical protein
MHYTYVMLKFQQHIAMAFKNGDGNYLWHVASWFLGWKIWCLWGGCCTGFSFFLLEFRIGVMSFHCWPLDSKFHHHWTLWNLWHTFL